MRSSRCFREMATVLATWRCASASGMILLAMTLAGCSDTVSEALTGSGDGNDEETLTDRLLDRNERGMLPHFVTAYHTHHDYHRRGPADWDALIAFAREQDLEVDALEKMRREGYEVAWGVQIREAVQGTDNFILAYRPEVVDSGGQVVMLSGAIKEIPASEIQQILEMQADIAARRPPPSDSGTADRGEPGRGSGTTASGSGNADPLVQDDGGRDAGSEGDVAVERPDGRPEPRAPISGNLPGLPIDADTPLKPGDDLFIYWGSTWYEGEVVELGDDGRVKISYSDYDSSWDEYVARTEIRRRPPATEAADDASGSGDPSDRTPDGMRMWTDASGSYNVEARYVSRSANEVVLETPNGERITVGFDQLSAHDQRWIERQDEGDDG